MKIIKRFALFAAATAFCSSLAMADISSANLKMEKQMARASHLIDRAILHGRSNSELAGAKKAMAEARYAADRAMAKNDEAALLAAADILAKETSALEEMPTAKTRVDLWPFAFVALAIAAGVALVLNERRRKRAHWAKLLAEFETYQVFLSAAKDKRLAIAKLEPTLADLVAGDEQGEQNYKRMSSAFARMKNEIDLAYYLMERMSGLAGLSDNSRRPAASDQAVFEDEFTCAQFHSQRSRDALTEKLKWAERLFPLMAELAKVSKVVREYRPIPEDLDTVLDGGLTPREVNAMAEKAATFVALAHAGFSGQYFDEVEADINAAKELAKVLAPRRGEEPIAVTIAKGVTGLPLSKDILEECWQSACIIARDTLQTMEESGIKPGVAFDEAFEELSNIPYELANADRQLQRRQHLAASGTLALVSGKLEEIRNTFDACAVGKAI